MASALIEEKVEHLFAKAIKELDIDLLHRLIKPIGEYDAQDEKLEIIHLSKEAYIEWIVNKRRKIEDIDYYFDQCLLCSIGNTVVIFNDGYFPHKVKENAGQSKAGLMLNVTDGQIDTIKF